MSTNPVDKSVGKIRIKAKNPTILEIITEWLNFRHFCKAV
jgi:hypothetical protein